MRRSAWYQERWACIKQQSTFEWGYSPLFLVWGRCQRRPLIPRNDLRNAGVAGRETWWPRRTPGMTAEFDAVDCRHKASFSAGSRLIHSVSEGTYLLIKSLMDLQCMPPCALAIHIKVRRSNGGMGAPEIDFVFNCITLRVSSSLTT